MLLSYAISLGEVISKVSTKPKRPIGKDKPQLQKVVIPKDLLKEKSFK
ncbi:5214_t:CDS:2, partial [Dentiscutata heterogama]